LIPEVKLLLALGICSTQCSGNGNLPGYFDPKIVFVLDVKPVLLSIAITGTSREKKARPQGDKFIV